MRLVLETDGGLRFEALEHVAGDIWRGSLGDLVDITGGQEGRLITLADLVSACERIDNEEAGLPFLRLVQ